MKKVLVTGGLGFIGSNFVKHLVQNRPELKITVYDALTYAGNVNNLDDVKNKVGILIKNVCDKEAVEKAISKSDVVCHLAAESHVDNSINDAHPFVMSNIYGTFRVLEAVKKFKTPLINVSTSEVYGTAVTEPMTEEHPLNPLSPYAASKCSADRLAFSYRETYNIPVTTVRPFNNYGPYQYLEKLIPMCITQALQNKKIIIFGHGKTSRDWLHAIDTAKALEKLLDYEHKGEVINLGANNERSVIEIAELIVELMGKDANIKKLVQERPGEVHRHVGSTSRAKRLIGWEPRIRFEEGLENTIEWYKKNPAWWKALVSKRMKLLLGMKEERLQKHFNEDHEGV